MSDPRFIVLIADVVRSRRYSANERRELQKRLITLVTLLNETYGWAMVSVAAITTGDEFQLVLRDATRLPDILWETWTILQGNPVRISVGSGGIQTEAGQDPRLMDGSAFHEARAALGRARRAVAFRGFGAQEDQVLDGLGQALDELQRGFSTREREVLGLLRSGMLQREAADQLGVKQQAVSGAARRAGWRAYLAVELALTSALELFGSASKGYA